jgi:predicted Zn finger-like uncharacterized protein
MSLTIECAACHSKYRVGEHAAGKKLRCKKCGAAIRVPGAPPALGPGEQPAAPAPTKATPRPAKKPAAPRADDGGAFDLGSLLDSERAAKASLQPAQEDRPMPMPAAPAPGARAPAPAAPAPRGNPYRLAPSRGARGGGSGMMKFSVTGIVNTACLALLGVLVVAFIVGLSGSRDVAGMLLLVVLICGIGIGLLGSLRMIIVPFQESIVCGFFYLFVPFYPLYYLFTRWSAMAPGFLTSLKGVGLIIAALFAAQGIGSMAGK